MDVIPRQIRVLVEDLCLRSAMRQEAKNELDDQASAPDDGFAHHDIRIEYDSLKELLVVHEIICNKATKRLTAYILEAPGGFPVVAGPYHPVIAA